MMKPEKIGQFPPIPINDNVLESAWRLKRLGLPWSPHVGCFVWDREAVISVPSPFPQRVYFILSMRRFTNIFGSEANMRQQLVWVPTWHQAVQLCRHLGVSDVKRKRFFLEGEDLLSKEAGLLQVYGLISQKLAPPGTKSAVVSRKEMSSGAQDWIRSVMKSELGSLAHLPQDVRHRVESIYEQTATAYLGWRRIQEEKPVDWLPPETSFDARLLSDLGHFYSDYQNLIKSMTAIRKGVKRIKAIDPSKESERFQRLIGEMLAIAPEHEKSGQILARLIKPE